MVKCAAERESAHARVKSSKPLMAGGLFSFQYDTFLVVFLQICYFLRLFPKDFLFFLARFIYLL